MRRLNGRLALAVLLAVACGGAVRTGREFNYRLSDEFYYHVVLYSVGTPYSDAAQDAAQAREDRITNWWLAAFAACALTAVGSGSALAVGWFRRVRRPDPRRGFEVSPPTDRSS